jgi:prevent-host-death family protein
VEKINVSEFKATSLGLLEKVRQTVEPIEILKNGVPLAVVHPALPLSRAGAFGAMKSTLRAPLGDLTQPVEGVEWEVLEDLRAKSQASS